jgi:hypothetical protein
MEEPIRPGRGRQRMAKEIRPFTRSAIAGPSAQLFDDEEKVHPVSPEERDGNVRHYCDDLTFQAVQELLQFALVGCHPDIEAVDPVFHLSYPLS